MNEIIAILAAAVVAAGGFVWRNKLVTKLKAIENPTKKDKRIRKLASLLIGAALYVVVTQLIILIFGEPDKRAISVELAPARMNFLGLDISETILYSWVIILGLILLALILRVTVIRHLKDEPSGVQNVLELMIEKITQYTKSTAHGVGDFFAAYVFSVAAFLVGCSVVELFGFRTPASDITMTGALAILSFIFINIYGFRVKGFGGRVKSMATPTAFILPIRIVTDLAVPVSLASRLFGNMLGGLVIMDLLYTALGSYAVGIPSVAGLYFNVFHPLLQAFIFVTLTLKFINEATE